MWHTVCFTNAWYHGLLMHGVGDTDSIFLCLAGKSLRDLVPAHRQHEFDTGFAVDFLGAGLPDEHPKYGYLHIECEAKKYVFILKALGPMICAQRRV